MTPDSFNGKSEDWLDHLYGSYSNDGGTAIRKTWPVRRLISGLGFTTSALLLGLAYYLQYAENVQPCPLCSLQRLLIGIMGIAFLISFLWYPSPRIARKRGVLIAAMATLGVMTVSYQLWFQAQLVDEQLLCSPPLYYVIAAFSPNEVVNMIIGNPIGCNSSEWTLLGLRHDAWNGIGFMAIAGLALGSRREHC